MKKTATCIALAGIVVLCVAAGERKQYPFTIRASLSSAELASAQDITVTVTLSASDVQKREFDFGSFPQCFGVYILGPWGPIQPDVKKVRPENWMHQEHSPAKRIVVTKDRPFKTFFKLSDYFPITHSSIFRPGEYQMNIKFFDVGLGMPRPIDSGPVTFIIKEGPSNK